MNCAAEKCKFNYRNVCLNEADADQLEDAKTDIEKNGFTLFDAYVEIDAGGRCRYFTVEG